MMDGRAPVADNQDECLFTGLALEWFGGSFAQAIGTALIKADGGNRRILIKAFGEGLLSDFGPGSIFYEDAKKRYRGR